MADSTTTALIIAFAAGFLPPLFWLLFFWLREDAARPEPRRIIALTFVLGIVAAYPAYKLQKFSLQFFEMGSLELLFLWALSEETVKFLAAFFGALWHNQSFDEPIDAMVYLITAAMGFSAMENFLFLYTGIQTNTLTIALADTGLRFLGATMLHALSSATLGAVIGFAFYKQTWIKDRGMLLGLILATLLHTIYNKFILLQESGSNKNLMGIFGAVWVGLIIILFFFEKIKSIFKPVRLA